VGFMAGGGVYERVGWWGLKSGFNLGRSYCFKAMHFENLKPH